jgi:hypothetical protein
VATAQPAKGVNTNPRDKIFAAFTNNMSYHIVYF